MFKNNVHVVIMAGGVGSRFWPMSTVDTPKQFIDILGCGRTFIQMTYDRFKDLCQPENVWVVTSANYAQVVREQLPELPVENILLEPCRRNTAPCIAYVSWRIKSKNPNANIVVAPSDHIILNTQHFQKVVTSALDFTENSDTIVTLGMKPNRPETGYGYIQADLSYSSPRNKNIFRVDQFKEKPDLETAKRYIKSDNFFWNSGLFIWNVNTIVNAFRVYQPVLSRTFESLLPYYGTDKEQELINEVYPKCENISVDYAILEKADEIFVYPADFGWSDVGTWSALHKLSPCDEANNALIGTNINVYESRNCIIHTTGERKVVVQGLDGYIIAEHEDTLLVCKLSEEQRIKFFSEN
ncbi:MAG: mannose-1-phosphate guanylyltransferase [Bacteroidaceae bacterium]|nr:mannose-1-phosphate guanylyltransferase [Bacteroidaceae bacterium]